LAASPFPLPDAQEALAFQVQADRAMAEAIALTTGSAVPHELGSCAPLASHTLFQNTDKMLRVQGFCPKINLA